MSTPASDSKVRSVIRVASGNFLEMYDFMVFAYYASYIAREIFPSNNQFASLMMTLGTFGAGYLMRPLGAVVLGTYVDRKGRREGLLFTLSLMAVGTLVIALTPSYRTIGIIAPIVVVLGRLLQGFSAGVELGGVSVYLAEIATPGHRGFYCAWQSGSQQVAVMFAALLGVTLSWLMPPEQMTLWGWRVPFLVGCLIVPLLFWMRSSLKETEVFLKRKRHPGVSEILLSLVKNWGIIGVGMFISTMTTVSFYLITAYTPTYGREVLQLSARTSLMVTLFVGLSNFIWVPIGRRHLGHRGQAARAHFCLGRRHRDPLSGNAVAGQQSVVCAPADCGVVAFRAVRQFQRSHGAVPHGNHAAGHPNLRLFRGVQPGHRDLWRLYTGHLHLLDSRDRKSRHARALAFLRGDLRADCYSGFGLAGNTGCGAGIHRAGGLIWMT